MNKSKAVKQALRRNKGTAYEVARMIISIMPDPVVTSNSFGVSYSSLDSKLSFHFDVMRTNDGKTHFEILYAGEAYFDWYSQSSDLSIKTEARHALLDLIPRLQNRKDQLAKESIMLADTVTRMKTLATLTYLYT